MVKKEDVLRDIFKAKKGDRIKTSEDSLKNIDEIKKVYKDLTGTLTKIPLRISNFSIKIDSKTFIELDDQLHFNRYRLQTLKSEIYQNCKLFNVEEHKRLCEEHEPTCLRIAGDTDRWKTNNSEKAFLKSGPEKKLEGNGSSRWKQKAFFDFIKDVYAIENEINLKRVSVWETVKGNITIKQILDEEIKEHYENLKKHILRKFEV